MTDKLISTRKRGIVLIVIMMIVALGVATTANIILYRVYFNEQKNRLVEMTNSQATWFRAAAKLYREKARAQKESITNRDILKHFQHIFSENIGFGKTGEFAIARKTSTALEYIFNRHNADLDKALLVPLKSQKAFPMKLALEGKTGTIVADDYRGKTVLAAFAPIEELDVGIVTKIELQELRAPFVQSGWLNGIVVFVLILIGAELFRRVGHPMVVYQDEQEEKYKSLFQNSQLGILVISDVIEDCNEKICEFWSLGKTRILKQSAPQLFLTGHNEGDSAREKIISYLGQAGSDDNYSFRWTLLNQKGAKRFLEIMIKRISVRQKDLILAMVSDVTETVENEIKRLKLESQLRHSQKMETAGRLAGGIAHDYNNILATITLNADILFEALKGNKEALEDLSLIKDAVERGRNLTGQLLTFSRRKPVNLEPVDLNGVITDLIKMINRLIGEEITVETRFIKNKSMVYADRGSLDQVIMNLTINAKDAMPQGGELILETSLINIDTESRAKDFNCKKGEYICLKVKDSGLGMGPETLSNIFEPFFTTKEMGKGTGLGLSTVYGIIKQINGGIRVDSKLGEGTTFSILIPKYRGAPRNSPAPVKENREFIGEGTVLILEDDTTVRNSVTKILKHFGFNVLTASNSIEGSEKFSKNKMNIVLIISDVVLPDSSGPDFVEGILKETSIPALFISGYTDKIFTDYKNVLNRNNFIQKPFTKKQLAEKLMTLLGLVNPEREINNL